MRGSFVVFQNSFLNFLYTFSQAEFKVEFKFSISRQLNLKKTLIFQFFDMQMLALLLVKRCMLVLIICEYLC